MVVLIVDDSRAMRQIQRKVVSQLGDVDILEAEDGVSAVYQLHSLNFQVDLVLLDWMMPRMDGLTLVKLMKSNENLCRIPILMVTSHSDEHKIREAWLTGADGYLLKPFTREMFLQAIIALAPVNSSHINSTAVEEAAPSRKSFLDELMPDMRKEILDMVEIDDISKGTLLLNQGSVAEIFYLLLDGKVEEQRLNTGTSSIVRTYGPGECFGVTELMTGDALKNQFSAVVPSKVAHMQKSDFETMLLNSPEISLTLSRYLAGKASEIRKQSSKEKGESILAGALEVLELSDLIQALSLRQKTGMIELSDIGSYIAISHGQVVAAHHPECDGEEAFLRILRQNSKTFRFIVKPLQCEPNIRTNTVELLLKTMKKMDETKKEALRRNLP